MLTALGINHQAAGLLRLSEFQKLLALPKKPTSIPKLFSSEIPVLDVVVQIIFSGNILH